MQADGEQLAALRVEAMRESLERVGRFDPVRARERFLLNFEPRFTHHIVRGGERVGFFVLRPADGGLLLDHLYVRPGHQGRGIGAAVLAHVFELADAAGQAVRVGALRASESNRIYARHGFALVEQAEFDNYYVRHANLPLRLRTETMDELSRHLAIPSIYESSTVFEVLAASDGYALRERPLDHAFRKNYDLAEDPLSWPRQFDLSNWILVAAFHGTTRVGGALAALNTPGVDLLEGRSDLAVLWDLRVAPEARRRGVASALMAAIEASARKCGCRELKVETQNTNVAACKLYSALGCRLAQANFGGYPDLPQEVQLIWRKDIA